MFILTSSAVFQNGSRAGFGQCWWATDVPESIAAGLGPWTGCANVYVAGFLLGWIEDSFELRGVLNRFGSIVSPFRFIVTGSGRPI